MQGNSEHEGRAPGADQLLAKTLGRYRPPLLAQTKDIQSLRRISLRTNNALPYPGWTETMLRLAFAKVRTLLGTPRQRRFFNDVAGSTGTLTARARRR